MYIRGNLHLTSKPFGVELDSNSNCKSFFYIFFYVVFFHTHTICQNGLALVADNNVLIDLLFAVSNLSSNIIGIDWSGCVLFSV